MIQKQDLILLLTELEDSGIEVSNQLQKVITSSTIPLDVLKFINDRRELDVTNFYRYLRKSYNDKKSKLYKNIVSEVEDPQTIVTTLGSFALQVLLYSKKVEDKATFLKHSRFEEVEKCLINYSKTFDLITCSKLLKLLKADCKAIESIYR